jgi:hypothetical protein
MPFRVPLIPFFVVDRPASLAILKGVMLRHPKVKVGLMTHALTSEHMWDLFRDFPRGTPLLYEDDGPPTAEEILGASLVKMTDSGIFNKGGCKVSYEDLFDRYSAMGTDFGVMIDVLQDSKATLKSAERALHVFHKKRRQCRFKLVAVAQGKNLEEYLECYRTLARDFEFVAVGGLLKKRENSARYVTVRSEEFIYAVIDGIKREFKTDWLFPLGCYHPSRHSRFEEIGVWGSDYKGWIFNYRLKRQLLSDLSATLSSMETQGGDGFAVRKWMGDASKVQSELLRTESRWREASDNRRKARLWRKVWLTRKRLDSINQSLLSVRERLLCNNGLPRSYRPRLKEFRNLIETEEQALRFRQVRSYIETNVYRQLERTLVVIPCGKQKVWRSHPSEGPTRAEDAYTSNYFNLCKRYAQAFSDEWVVLSGKYGILRPRELVKGNYDVRVKPSPRFVVTIREQMRRLLGNKISRIVSLCGNGYTRCLQTTLGDLGVSFHAPLSGMRIGQRQAILKKHIEAGRAL